MGFFDSLSERVTELFVSKETKPAYVVGLAGNSRTQRGRETTNRLDPNLLELVYNKDPIAFNGTNLIVRTILSTDHHIEPGLKRDNKVIEQILPQRKLDKILKYTFKHGIIFGHAWYEILTDSEGKIVDLEVLDPKTMDYMRDDFGIVIYDETGRKPKNYIQYIPNNAPEVPGEIRVLGRRCIPLDLDKIVHFKFNDLTDSSVGVGMIEPLYNTIKIKMNIELGLSQSIIRHGFPIFHAKLGDERHEPLPDQIDQMYENLQNLDESTELVTPYYNQIEILESKQTTDTAQHLSYFIDQQIAGFGVPRPLVTGGGEATNRSVLERQQVIFQQTLKDLMDTVSVTYEEHIFNRIKEDYDLTDIPRLLWDDTNIESLSSKAERLQGYAGVGLLIADKPLRDHIRDKERLPAETKEDIVETKPREVNDNPGNPKQASAEPKKLEKGSDKPTNYEAQDKELKYFDQKKFEKSMDKLFEKMSEKYSQPINIKVEQPPVAEPVKERRDPQEEFINAEIQKKKVEVLDKLLGGG